MHGTPCDKAFLQPAKAAAMCMALCAETRPPPPIPPFLVAQNLSSKRIAPTDKVLNWMELGNFNFVAMETVKQS